MKKEKLLLIVVIVAVLVGCLVGVGLLLAPDDAGDTATTMPTTSQDPPTQSPSDPTDPSDPTPSDPTDPCEPTDPSEPTEPSEPTAPSEPTEPSEPDEPEKVRKAEFVVTQKDGTVAQGAAVIATHSSGRQVYEPTNEKGVAVLSLLEGKHTVHIVYDGQSADVQLQVGDQPLQKKVQLQADRKLYIMMTAVGAYEGDPRELASFSVLEKVFNKKYPDAVYLTHENRYDVEFHDGDALITVEVFVENYTSNEQYFASEVRVKLQTYQECITAWGTDQAGQEIETEFFDGNVYSIRIRNDYDYDYKDSVSVITESYYVIERNWHIGPYSCRADDWGYGYSMDDVRSSTSEQKVKAPGAGMKTEPFWYDINSNRYQEYSRYAEQIFPVVDLWFSDEWNQKVQQLEL